MVGGEAATRILKEVERGIVKSKDDTPEEREYREEIRQSIEKIRKSGAAVEVQKEWP